ncbi:tyrosine-type recombinase/integrase [Streptomyces malaysiensis]|uniref:tyrosine-type recombinase/integrase n=1 Tax=Streptomyces malaysiensis TaxID=92644 RepID=UPI00367D962A
MPGYIEDRWFRRGPVDPVTRKPTREKTARHGQGKRYKVAGIPGVRARSFDRKADADAWKAKAEHESKIGEFIDSRRGLILFRAYVEDEWWPSKSGDPATLNTIKGRVWTHLLPHLGALPLNSIKTPQLRALLKALESTIGPGTIHEAWGYLSSILQAAVDDERITKNYCKTSKSIKLPMRPPRKARAWSRERVAAVREGMKPRCRIMVDIGVSAGLRQSEVFGLAVEDIDEAKQIIHVRRQVKKVGAKLVFALPKGGKTRTAPAPPELLARLRAHLKEFPAKKVTLPWKDPRPPETDREAKERAPQTFELIITGAQGGALRRDSFNDREWKPALVAAGVIPPPVQVRQGKDQRAVWKYVEAREEGFHALRHTAASVWLDARESIVSVSNWLGHEDASITLRIYAHMMPEADGRGRDAMNAWLKAAS